LEEFLVAVGVWGCRRTTLSSSSSIFVVVHFQREPGIRVRRATVEPWRMTVGIPIYVATGSIWGPMRGY
jgi:hypothetical protein